MERDCNVILLCGFKSANYGLNLIKSYFLPNLVNQRDIEHTVIKKANQFISFKFGDIHRLDIMNLVGGGTNFESLMKSNKMSETKRFFPYEWFDHPDKMENTELPPFNAFYSKLRSCNRLETDYNGNTNLFNSGLPTKEAVIQLKLTKPPPIGNDNYQYLQQLWKQH